MTYEECALFFTYYIKYRDCHDITAVFFYAGQDVQLVESSLLCVGLPIAFVCQTHALQCVLSSV